ncbi:MAG: hypothetical protein AVDCRST_MAG93-3395, partial [uncultured Chloroflexia bacterium]
WRESSTAKPLASRIKTWRFTSRLEPRSPSFAQLQDWGALA